MHIHCIALGSRIGAGSTSRADGRFGLPLHRRYGLLCELDANRFNGLWRLNVGAIRTAHVGTGISLRSARYELADSAKVAVSAQQPSIRICGVRAHRESGKRSRDELQVDRGEPGGTQSA